MPSFCTVAVAKKPRCARQWRGLGRRHGMQRNTTYVFVHGNLVRLFGHKKILLELVLIRTDRLAGGRGGRGSGRDGRGDSGHGGLKRVAERVPAGDQTATSAVVLLMVKSVCVLVARVCARKKERSGVEELSGFYICGSWCVCYDNVEESWFGKNNNTTLWWTVQRGICPWHPV
jgi:hypothetical protein